MANAIFDLFDDLTVTSSSVSGAGSFTVLTSAEIVNQTALQSLRVILNYKNINPDFGSFPQTFFIDSIVESENDGSNKWFPIAYQFSPFKNSINGEKRIILLQPDLNTFDSGIDDIVFIGNKTEARISRQQGKLGASNFRVRVVITETNPTASGSFKSVNIDGYGEMFDAV